MVTPRSLFFLCEFVCAAYWQIFLYTSHWPSELCVFVFLQPALTRPLPTRVFVCVNASERVSQPYLQICLIRNYWGAPNYLFFQTDRLFFAGTVAACLRFKAALKLKSNLGAIKSSPHLHPCRCLQGDFWNSCDMRVFMRQLYLINITEGPEKESRRGKKLAPERKHAAWKGQLTEGNCIWSKYWFVVGFRTILHLILADLDVGKNTYNL